MRPHHIFSLEEARRIGEVVGIDWRASPFPVEEFRAGLSMELEHGRCCPDTDVTNDDPVVTAKIALGHLRVFPDYYKRLAEMEREAERYHKVVASAPPPKRIWA